jgi:KDO2-lipid IV(A) lauroyltransferase
MAESRLRNAASSPRRPLAEASPALSGGRGGVPLRHRAAGLALRVVTSAFRRMPEILAYAIADAAALPLVAVTLLHERRVAPLGRGLFRNQRIVFREGLSRRESRRLLFAWARHMGRLFVDFCRMPRLAPESAERSVDVQAFRELIPLAEEGRGLICVSGHLGVWELCPYLPSLLGFPVTVVVRPTGIAPVDAVLTAIRSAGGTRVLNKWGILLPLKRALERGEMVGLLADEDARERPIFAPFLGTLAATTPSVAFLQRVTGAPIVVASVHRVGRGRWRCHVWRVIRSAPAADAERAEREVTEAVNEALSRAILAYPEQWFWGSRRFFTRPPGERPGPDGLPPRAAREG